MKHRWSKCVVLIGAILALSSSMFSVVLASEGDGNYVDSFPLQTFDFRMYVVSLNISETFNVNVTAVSDGEFDLFLFSTRPQQSYITRNIDDPYDPEIFNNITGTTLAYDVQNGTISSITYTPNDPEFPVALYYLQVVLRSNGPDSYNLEANHLMELYFIPFIPGYPIWIIGGIFILTSGFIFLKIRKNII